MVPDIDAEDGLDRIDTPSGEADVVAGSEERGHFFPFHLAERFAQVGQIHIPKQADRQGGTGFVAPDRDLHAAIGTDHLGNDRLDGRRERIDRHRHALGALLVDIEGIEHDRMRLRVCETFDGQAVHIAGDLRIDRLAVPFILRDDSLQVLVIGDGHLDDRPTRNAPDTLDGYRARNRDVDNLVDAPSQFARAGRQEQCDYE